MWRESAWLFLQLNTLPCLGAVCIVVNFKGGKDRSTYKTRKPTFLVELEYDHYD
jgi:hypothetical protein